MAGLNSLKISNFFIVNRWEFNLIFAYYIFQFFQTLPFFNSSVCFKNFNCFLTPVVFNFKSSKIAFFRFFAAIIVILSSCYCNVVYHETASVTFILDLKILPYNFYRRAPQSILQIFVIVMNDVFAFVIRMNIKTLVFYLSCLRYFFTERIAFTQHW